MFAELKLFELCLMSAWIDGDFPCWMGMGWCWISLKMESIGDCLEVWAVLCPIHFEVWVWRGVSQMLHVQTKVWKISDQVWLCHDGLKRWGLAQRATPQIWSRDLINSKSFYYCKTSFQNFEVVFKRWSDSKPRQLCRAWDTVRMTTEIKSARVTYSSKELHQVSRQGRFDRARITWPRP